MDLSESLKKNFPLSILTFEILGKEYPAFSKTKFYIYQNFDENYFFEFEEFLNFSLREASNKVFVEDLLFSKVKSFIRYSHEFSVLQIKLNRTLNYQYSTFEEVKEKVYNNQIMDDYYLDGLAFSQYLWPNHYKMNRFLIDGLRSLGSTCRAIDVPCGPGIQSWLARRHCNIGNMTLTDLSAYSVNYSRQLHSYFHEFGEWAVNQSPIEECKGEFNLIINGELMEHVEDPRALLAKLDRMLSHDGMIYLTTAIFAAAIDHIYMFRSAQEVRTILMDQFHIVSELVLPVSLTPHREDMYNEPINYACFLRRK
jgi:2-polyprenyl-3-methyl-5-hydroxy-6-metoxy-1,4-benzoquinol methylase